MKKDGLYKNLPETPGAYLMKDARGTVIYVGKAVNLKRRVSSYFLRPHDARIEALVMEIADIGHLDTDTGLEALILESSLIKKYAPKYNIKDKDDKSFLHVVFSRGAYPRPAVVRGKDKRGGGTAFGPFVSSSSLRSALRALRFIFPWAEHSPGKKGGKPCFDYQLGLCPGTCIGAVTRAEYAKNIRNLKLFFRGEKRRVIASLEADMAAYGKALEFEKAQAAKKKLFALRHIQDVAMIHDAEIADRGACPERAQRIEGYDISNISGTAAVGAMVVFINGKPEKGEYRLFNIKGIFRPDDTGMMREVLERRLENPWPLPQAILVDGGEGQVNMAEATLVSRGLDIPVVGIAKGADRKNNRFVGIVPEFAAEKTLIAVRDEAHRFSRSAHIRRRGKEFLS